MANEQNLCVLREVSGSYELTGVLSPTSQGASFSYVDAYLASSHARAISAVLPLREGTHDARATRTFFDGLLPEGPLRRAMSDAFHMSADDYPGMLSRLNNESAGALVFCGEGEDPAQGRGYDPLPRSELEAFAHQPRSSALSLSVASRLSLAGAQAKVGLHHVGDSLLDGWLFPRGSAPSTYVIKAVDGTFPHQTVNEALCLRVAGRLGFEVPEVSLLAVDGVEPLLAVSRFDRVAGEGEGFPWRRHQEDFCQATGLSSTFKYEPSGGHYLSRMAAHVSRESSNPFGDRMALFSRLLFDWAIGNCDNHLKNHAMLWDESWESCELAPLYDVTCTTVYPELDREMGVSLCPSRRIDDVTKRDLLDSAHELGVPESVALAELDELGERFLPALDRAQDELVDEGYPAARRLVEHIGASFERRLDRLGR